MLRHFREHDAPFHQGAASFVAEGTTMTKMTAELAIAGHCVDATVDATREKQKAAAIETLHRLYPRPSDVDKSSPEWRWASEAAGRFDSAMTSAMDVEIPHLAGRVRAIASSKTKTPELSKS